MKTRLCNLSPKELRDWLLDRSKPTLLIDVREDQELDIAPFPSKEVVHLPLSQSSRWMDNLPELFQTANRTVVLCHSGIRSMQFASWLLEEGWLNEVWNLDGGIDAWSVEVDPTIPRY